MHIYRWLDLFLIAILLSLDVHASAVSAAPLPVPVPKATLVPVTGDSYPFVAADHQQTPQDLAKAGYVEEEYFLSGTANVYDWPGPARATIRVPNAPYTNRILVRRPRDKQRLSGNVIIEIFNATAGFDWPIGWDHWSRYTLSRGDVWIGVTSKPVNVTALKQFNPTRYATLNWANPVPLSDPLNCREIVKDPDPSLNAGSSRTTEHGLFWDIFSQTAMWARTQAEFRSPRRELRVYGYGFSLSARYIDTYAAAVHPLAKQPNGRPVFDGFLAVAGADQPFAINQCSPRLRGGGAGQVRNAGVPIIRIASTSEVTSPQFVTDLLSGRRNDSDQPEDQFREYETAATVHFSPDQTAYAPAIADVQAAGGSSISADGCNYDTSHGLSTGIFESAGFTNLDRWVRQGLPPPPGRLLNVRNAQLVLDSYGNPTGGVHSPYVDVPTTRWFADSGPGLCDLAGAVDPFSMARLARLYPHHATYVHDVLLDISRLTQQRYLNVDDGLEIIRRAWQSRVPYAPDLPSYPAAYPATE